MYNITMKLSSRKHLKGWGWDMNVPFEFKQKLNKLPLANKEALTISIYGVVYIY